MDNLNAAVRPLGAELAEIRELTTEEVGAVSGGVSKSCTGKVTYDDGGDAEVGCTIDF